MGSGGGEAPGGQEGAAVHAPFEDDARALGITQNGAAVAVHARSRSSLDLGQENIGLVVRKQRRCGGDWIAADVEKCSSTQRAESCVSYPGRTGAAVRVSATGNVQFRRGNIPRLVSIKGPGFQPVLRQRRLLR